MGSPTYERIFEAMHLAAAGLKEAAQGAMGGPETRTGATNHGNSRVSLRGGAERMYARMTVAQVQPEHIDKAVTAVRDAFLPAAQEQPGYRGFLLLTERDKQRLVGISFWESEADVQSSGGTGGYYQQRIAEFAGFLVAPATTTIHEVAVWEPRSSDSAAACS